MVIFVNTLSWIKNSKNKLIAKYKKKVNIMLISDAILSLQLHTKKIISQTEIAKVLGISAVALNKRIIRKSELKVSEAAKLISHYGCNILADYKDEDDNVSVFSGYNENAIEISYYENPLVKNTIKNPLMISLWLDRELVRNVWKKDEKTLRLAKMPGDGMNGGVLPIRNNDLLIIDTKDNDILSSGIYAYTTNEDNLIFINGIKQKMDGSVKFYYFNQNYNETIYNKEDLENVDFKIIGRIIKNMSVLI